MKCEEELDDFILSSVDVALLLLRNRHDASHKGCARLSVFLHLFQTLSELRIERMSGVFATKLRLLLWAGLKIECTGARAPAAAWHSAMSLKAAEAELSLARELFGDESLAAAPLLMDEGLLAWFVLDVLLPSRIAHPIEWPMDDDHPFLLWAARVLDAVSAPQWRLPTLPQRVVEISVLLCADAALAASRAALFTTAYLHTLVAARGPELIAALTLSIRSGVIRGDQLYRSDLFVLLETLRRFASADMNEEQHRAVTTAMDVLLHTATPSKSDGVDVVCDWFSLLGLAGEYRKTLTDGAIDGEVLQSHLSLTDVKEMGITLGEDAAIVVRVLHASPQER